MTHDYGGTVDEDAESGQHEPHRGPLGWYVTRRASARGNASLDLVWRLVAGIAGTLVLIAGILMLALPGPGWATIVLGLAILSTEFAWARRLRLRVVAKLNEFNDRHAPRWRIPLWGWLVLAILVSIAGFVILRMLDAPSWLTVVRPRG
jgi:uncharacterized protein (TIGR02611 family)